MAATCTADVFNTQIPQQIPQYQLTVSAHEKVNSPWTNTIEGGTVENNQGETLRTLTPGRMVTNQSYAAPEFETLLGGCNPTGPVAEFGSTEYNSVLQQLAGEGPKICLANARSTVIGMYRDAEIRLKEAITEIKGQDISNVYSQRSGFKVRLSATATGLSDIATGGEWQVDVNYPGGLPTGYLSWPLLRKIDTYIKENMQVQLFGAGNEAHSVFIGSSDAVETLRNDTSLKGDYNLAVQGSFGKEKSDLWKFAFVETSYRGIKFAIDHKNKRFATLDGNGNPIFIEPYVNSVTDNGVIRTANPAWVDAPYELGFLVYKGAFKYNIPKQYAGEALMKFGPQFWSGQIEWFNVKSDCNKFGDVGNFIYRIARSIHPVMPHAVVPIMIQRCGGGWASNLPCESVSA
jgi:hypothetical protein